MTIASVGVVDNVVSPVHVKVEIVGEDVLALPLRAVSRFELVDIVMLVELSVSVVI